MQKSDFNGCKGYGHSRPFKALIWRFISRCNEADLAGSETGLDNEASAATANAVAAVVRPSTLCGKSNKQ